MRVAVYCRRSPNEAEDRTQDAKSVVRQAEHGAAFAEARGWQVVETHVDDLVSGATFPRKGLSALLAGAGANRFERVVVSELSRIGRDTLPTMMTIAQLERHGVEVWAYLSGRRISVAGETDEVITFIESWAAASERRRGGQRTRDTLKRLAEQGKPTGPAPYGFRIDRPNGASATLIIDEAQARVVRRIFRWRVQGLGYYKISEQLHGTPSPRGRGSWTTSQVRNMLASELYGLGRLRWGGITIDRPELAIIDPVTWERVRAMNRPRDDDGTPAAQRSRSAATKRASLLGGFVACGHCGSAMYKLGNRPSYVCVKRHNSGRKACPESHAVPAEQLEAAVLRAFEDVLQGALIIARLQALAGKAEDKSSVEALQRELAKVQAEERRLIELAARGGVDVHDALKERQARRRELERELAEVEDQPAPIPWAKVAKDIDRLLEDWQGALRAAPEMAQQVLRRLLPERLTVRWDGKRHHFRGRAQLEAVLDEMLPDLKRALERHSGAAGGLEGGSKVGSPRSRTRRFQRSSRRSTSSQGS